MIVAEGTVFLLLLLYGIFLIKQAHDRDTKLNQQKNNFLLSITHELKTPIAATKLQLQTLLKHNLTVEKQKELINFAIIENNRINELIDNVLLANNLNSGQYNLNIKSTNISDFLNTICIRYYNEYIQLNQLKTNIQPNIITNIDESAFLSIVTNIVNNAIKYTSAQKIIELELISLKNKIILNIKDNGVGLLSEDEENIYKPFYRKGNEETRNTKGSGLGLYITKYLCHLHKFKLNFTKNEPNGTIFIIEIPI
ncbi:MAG: HAMP domain-containing histidine kinase [Bacteroidetes bacterium]|nr:HAMP domain-containing histidine kinase [Bacteroidota bacterium]